MNEILQEDLQTLISEQKELLSELKNKSVLITGATGLIGSLFAKMLLVANQDLALNIKVLLLVRNKQKAEDTFKNFLSNKYAKIIVRELDSPITINEDIDCIIHAASVTQSKLFIENPVDVFTTSILGTKHILDLALDKKVSSVVYLSTMEMYGQINSEEKITESTYGIIDPLLPRSSYPISKLATENLCYSYFSQYQLPVKMARLTLTFGAGVFENDNRVFAQFIKSAMRGDDIVLHTKGETKRDYIYTTDALNGLLHLLLKGENGASYNIANTDTFISIREMAEMVANKFSNGKSKVVIKEQDLSTTGYASTVQINLDTTKLEKLGWEAKYSLEAMYERLLGYLEGKVECN